MLSQSTVGIPWSSRKHFLDKTEFIAPVYPYAKEHLYTSNLWNIILKHLSIKALTLDTSWHNLDKNYIDLWLLLMYIPTQKSKSQLNGPPLYKHKMFGTWSWNKQIFTVGYFSIFIVSFCMYVYFCTPAVLKILCMSIYKLHVCLTMPI